MLALISDFHKFCWSCKMEPSGRTRTPGLFTPSPSIKALKKPRNFVTILLNVACIILASITTICAAVTFKELNFPDMSDNLDDQVIRTILQNVEDTRLQTRVTCVFVFIVTTATVALQVLMIIITILNFGCLHQQNIFLFIEIAGGLICAAIFLAVAVALAVYSGEWTEFKELLELAVAINYVTRTDAATLIDFFNVNVLIPSTGAASAFGFLTTFTYIGLVVWFVWSNYTFVFKKDEGKSDTKA